MAKINRTVRTHTCGDLSEKNLSEEVQLCGWASTRRDHGGVIFVDLRDRYGLTQAVFDPALASGKTAHDIAQAIRSEFVLWVKGKVRRRPDGMTNPKMKTGQIEVACTELKILSAAKTPPFPIEDELEVAETVRLKYRYLDLRRSHLQRNLLVRHQIVSVMRNYLNEQQFVDVETPILYKSTPEGARDFIVPSRINPGTFYALPQSPQTLKQLLMISGMDRYYQIARCFRDEDLRADRQPEFTQLDIEMSFIDEEVLFPILEGMVSRIWKAVMGVELKTPFPRMNYHEAMQRFGCDKPDTRFGLELNDVSDIFAQSEFRVFKSALSSNARGEKGSIRCIKVMGEAETFSRKDLDDLTAVAAGHGAKGLLWIKIQQGMEMQSPAAKFFTDAEKSALIKQLQLKPDDLIVFVADTQNKVVFAALSAVRLAMAKKLNLIPTDGAEKPAFLWVTQFPLLEYAEADGRYYACHHPFTSPSPESVEDLIQGKNLDHLNAAAYDLVCNGAEVAGGSLRIYDQKVQAAMFKAIGMSEEEAQSKFGFFLEALQYGTPPHGGVAFGIDRLTGILCGTDAIRDVMAFPKTQKGHDLMADCPSEVAPGQLTELGISLQRRT